jgi:hypothetical protein
VAQWFFPFHADMGVAGCPCRPFIFRASQPCKSLALQHVLDSRLLPLALGLGEICLCQRVVVDWWIRLADHPLAGLYLQNMKRATDRRCASGFGRRKVPETQFNFGHSSPVRLRRGRVIVHQPAIVSSNGIVEWHARALVNFAVFMPGNRPAINTFQVLIAKFTLENHKNAHETHKNTLEIVKFTLENDENVLENAEFMVENAAFALENRNNALEIA